MATKRTWDDVLKDRGIDPNKRKVQQASKNSVSNINDPVSGDNIRQFVRDISQNAQQVAQDRQKALGKLNTLTLGDTGIKPQQPHVFGPAAAKSTIPVIEPEPAATENKKASKLPLLIKSIADMLKPKTPTVGNVAQSVIDKDSNMASDWGKRMGDYAVSGLGGAAKGIAKSAEMAASQILEPSPLNPVMYPVASGLKALDWASEKLSGEGFVEPIKELLKSGTESVSKTEQYYSNKANEGATPAEQFIGGGVQNAVAMLPQIALSIASGGTSVPASGIANATASGIPGLSTGAVTEFGQKLWNMMPFMTQAAGNYALDAEAKYPDATPEQIQAYAVAGGLSEGLTEMFAFGALEKALGIGEDAIKPLAKKGISNLIKSTGKKGLEWLINMGEQVAQEVAVDPMAAFAEKAFLNNDMPWIGEGGVIDFTKMPENAKGALAMSLVMTALGLPVNTISYAMAKESVGKEMTDKEIQELFTALEEELNNLETEVEQETAATSTEPINAPTTPATPKQVTPNIFANNALDKLDKAKADLLNFVANKPDTEVNQRKYETYREYISEAVPEASAEQIDAAMNELRKMEVESPPAKGDTQRRIDYLVNKIKDDLPQASKEQDTILPEQKPAEVSEVKAETKTSGPRSIEDRIVSLKNARTQLTEGTPGYETLSKKIAELEAERPAEVKAPATIAQPEITPADTGKVNIPQNIEPATVTSQKETSTEAKAETAPKEQPAQKPIDTSKYGRSGKAAFDKWTDNEWINVDLSKSDSKRTQMWLQLFDKYYNLGRENKPMPWFNEKGELEAEFPPFIQDEIYKAGKSDYEAQQKREPKKVESAQKADKIRAFKRTMYQGRGKSKEEIYETAARHPIMGEGQYYARDKGTASLYGDKITQKEVVLNNPLFIRDDVDWRNLTKEAGWKYPNPKIYDDTDQAAIKNAIDDSEKLKKLIVAKGHDGIIIEYEDSVRGDINETTGNAIKTLNDVFGHDQVVVYADEKPTENKQENGSKPESKSTNVGYHAGDLGKAEYFGNFYGSNRGTGHFGTGTYFVGDKSKLDGSYKDRPLHEVNLDGYKLYTPKTAKDAETLHDILKYANTYFEYRNMKHLDYDDLRSLDNDPEEAHRVLTEYDVFDDKKLKEDSGYTYQEIEEGQLWNRKIYDAFEKQINDLKNLNTTIGRALNGKRLFDENIEHLFGISAEKAEGMLQSVYNDVNAKMEGLNFYSMGDMRKSDSISTQFMKALGYEGVDVRHLPQFDNTGYGTVVYDLRENKKSEPAKTEGKPVDAKPENGGIIEGKNASAAKIADWVKKQLTGDKAFTFAELTKIADEAYGGTQGQGTYSSKDAYDAMELGINQYLLDNATVLKTNGRSVGEIKQNINILRSILSLVPTQTKGNTEQQTHQQFSTPPTIAYVASWVANITGNDTMLEPSAGIGGIAIFAKAAGAKVIVNELSDRRLGILKNMPFDGFYNENAEHINDILHDKISPTVVVMNPPFSATAGRMGNKNSTANAKAHIEQALEILQDGGRLVAIVGQGMADKAPAFSSWWKDIKSQYNVRANIGIYEPSETSRIQHSDEYKKYGTDFGVQLVVIDKNGSTTETIAKAEPSLENIIDLLEGVKHDRTAIETDRSSKQDTGGEPVQDGSGKTKGTDIRRPATLDTIDTVGQGERGTERTGGQESGTGRQDGGIADIVEPGTKSDVRKPDKRNDIPEGHAEIEGQSQETGNISVERDSGAADGDGAAVETAAVGTISKDEQINKVSEDLVYSEYKPQKVSIEGAKPHTSPLVQSTAMASVSPPDVGYTPQIPKKIITSGALSEAQMEAIIYAGQQHEKLNPDGTRKAFFIGDGTGVGKGREVSGIIMDNWNRGRKKAVWVSKNGKLFKDAIRDWTALGGNEGDVFKAPANKNIERDSGIMFTTYYTVPQGRKPNKKTGKVAELSRIDQIVNWLGKDYDGVVVFDESHMMQNLLGKNASEMAQGGDDLQDKLPNARVVYASATGATEVENFAYTKRLGLWGQGTSFSDVVDFVGKIKAGGLAAMELVARDLKAMGLYIARSVSFVGVKYDTKTHDLTDVQMEIYDKLAEGWQVVLQNMNKYMEKTGQSKNSQAKRFILQNFWSTQQRFFNQVLTSMQMPTVIEDMRKRLAAGESCVLQLVNTNAAAEEREVSRIEEEGGSLDDMDITPKGALLDMIDKCFPTQKYEEYLDDNGKKHSRPVVDSKGNPVEDPAAVAAKNDLMKQIDKMQIPSSPMDIIFQEFGVENVTEVTGRQRRFVYKRNKFGDLVRQEESRTEKVVEADVNDFLNDKKQILIFSDAGGTGKSYHAGKDFKNQRHRVHYLIQAGWNASKAVQGFGRTHRTNEASAPEYVLVTTNLKGQKRFISSIARRLDQLGALTKGQRQTGSSGLFSAKDNLESTEARDALELFYKQLAHNQIPGLNAEETLTKMGLLDKIMPDGVLTDSPEQLRKVTTFLNRILVLSSSEQNQVFDEFMGRLDYIVEEAIKNDRLDVGLENYKSAGANVSEEKVIHTDKTGAETKYIAITAKQKAMYFSYKEITNKDEFIGFYRDKESGAVAAAIQAVSKTNRDGSISKMYYMQSPTVGKRSHIVEKSLNEKWEKISKGEDKILWDKELKNEPAFREEKLHLISGALLPVWNRLPEGHTRVIRITTDDGNSHLGRLVPTHQIDETLRRLGASRKKESFNIRDSVNKVMTENSLIRLVDRTTISRAKVAGEYRLEIKADNVWNLQRRYNEIIDEKIGSTWRYFIPNNENGIKIIEKITEGAPILEVVANRSGETDDVQGFSSSTTAEMPRGDDSSTTSKTVDDLIKIIEKHTGVPIRTGKYRNKALGIFKVQPEVIRTKVRGDMPIISHELGHYLDKNFGFSISNEFKNELLKLGANTSKKSYDPKQVRAEGVAEFVRLYLTNPTLANAEAPLFMAHFEKSLDADTLKFLGMLRKEISAIKNLPNNKKIWNDISSGESRKTNGDAVSKAQRFYDAWINEQGIFAKLQSYAESKGWQGKNIDIMAQVYKGFEAKAMNMLFDKQRNLDGEIIGDSFMEIMDPLSPKAVKKRTGKRGNAIQEKKDFITYMVSRRAMDYKDRDLVMPQPWYVYEDNILDMEERYPHFVDVFEGLRKWEDNNLQLLVDSGIKTRADIAVVRYMNVNHVPLYRIRDAAEAIRAGSGNTLGQSKNVIKRAKGSGATIIDPLESMISDSFIIRRAAEANNIMRELYKMSGVEGIGSMVEKVPPGGRTTLFTVKEIRKQMLRSADAEIDAIKIEETTDKQQKELKQAEDYKKAIQDMSDEQLESVMSIYRPLFNERDNEVTVYVDGDKKLLQVDPQLHKAIKGLNREQMNIIMRALNAVKKVKQAGVVTSIPFVLRNFMRDTGTSLIQSEAGINPVDIMMGYASAIKKDKWYKEWVAAGGATEYVNINSRRQVQKIEDEVLRFGISEKSKIFIEALQEVKKNNNERTRGKLMNAAKNMFDIPVDMIRDAVEWSEAGARIAEFRKAVEKGVDKQTAAAWSRKLSVDFLRHGYTGKQVNAVVAFFNANVQGVVRIGETFMAHKARTLARGLIYITLPTMILYAINRDDEEYKGLPEWKRSMFWNIPTGDGKFISIPKPPGWGWIFGTLPEFALNKILDDDPEAGKELLSTFWDSFKFPTEVSAISPWIDVYANKQWNKSPIEGSYERDNKPAYLIRDERTSLLSSLIGDISKNHKGLSPKQIDYLIKQYLGTVGDFLWRFPDTVKAGLEMPSDVTQYPVIRSFITDAAYSSESVNDLYDIGEELDLRRKELIDTGKYPAMSHLPLEKQKELFASLEIARSEYNQLTDEFENARKAIKEVKDDEKMTAAQKKFKERAIKAKMNKIAAEFNERYRKFKQKYNIK